MARSAMAGWEERFDDYVERLGDLLGAPKEGPVRLDHAAQRLARRRRCSQEPVPPAEARRQVHAAVRGRLGQAHAGRERLAVGQPALLLAQPRQGGAGQGVEGLAASLAAIAAQPARTTPALRRCRLGAVRAARGGGERLLQQPDRLGLARRGRQSPPERRSLLPTEPLDQPQQHLEIRLAHRSPRPHHPTASLSPTASAKRANLKRSFWRLRCPYWNTPSSPRV